MEIHDVVVPIIDILPITQINSAKEDGKIAQENYTPSDMLKDFIDQKTIFETDAFRSGTSFKTNQPKTFSYSKKKFGKEKKTFFDFLVR